MNMITKPLVSVAVITYNASKTIKETLDSVKAQTYRNIELIVSDDCSTDDTVAICREWIEDNHSLFVRTEIVTTPFNTGIAANGNRAEAACNGEWIKIIAGDDLLLPNCITDCVDYVTSQPETVVLFGRMDVFGASKEENMRWMSMFNYSLFSLPVDELLYYLLFVDNGIPAPSMFYSRRLFEEYGIHNDERIPLLEDWPKWINISKAGIKMHLLDKAIVKYRLSGISTGIRSSLRYYESERMFRLLYLYPAWKKKDEVAAAKRLVAEESEVYKQLLEVETEEASAIHQQRNKYMVLYQKYYHDYTQIAHSWAYRIGKVLVRPFKICKCLKRRKNGE